MKRTDLLASLLVPVVATSAGLGIAGCGDRRAADLEPGVEAPGEPGAADEEPLPAAVAALASPDERLAAILVLGDEPGRLPSAAWREAESALASYLPSVTAEGLSWRVIYTDLPAGDFLAIDLLEGEGDLAPRRAWLHLLYRPAPFPDERFDGRPIRGFSTVEVPGRYLRVQLGELELLAVPDAAAMRTEVALRELVGRLDLEGLARLGKADLRSPASVAVPSAP
jgi:hypothetical protein